MNFSSKNRNNLIEQLAKNTFDILVIGGGITGAGIALDATARGLKVALVEMQDFASGTSGRSTKLIHGGLRYLKQGEFKLVAEVGKERQIIYKNAPHLTKPELMLLPLVKNGSLNMFSATIGMFIYEWLARVKPSERHKVLNKSQTLLAEPALKSDNLKGGILFYEYRTDDARLTIEVLKEAVARGALIVNYMRVENFIYKNKIISGAFIKDQLTEEVLEINANYVVNAGGPWVDELDAMDEKNHQNKLHITKGVHLVCDHKKLPVKQSLYFDTFDKRMLFVIPREGKTYIGTTDTFYSGNLNEPIITEEDLDYVLKCVNNFFPAHTLNVSDIESAWAGLRPLINKPGKGPSEISRKDEMFLSSSGMITIAGGKLTGYRKMAERVVNAIAYSIFQKQNRKLKECSTQHIPLSGGDMKSSDSFDELIKSKSKEGIAFGLTLYEALLLIHRYGSNVDQLYLICENLKKENSELPLFLRAQVHYAIDYEMCLSPQDFFIRRTGALYFNIQEVKKYQTLVFKYMQDIFFWKKSLSDKFREELDIAINNSVLKELKT
ncbi:MAG: FAD-dependent oxidoreductase [Bacteroidetes bacterium]|nr:FAD-dependent oxidoreductase [Bacteroidota bacterium]